jgi:hypothetical protein
MLSRSQSRTSSRFSRLSKKPRQVDYYQLAAQLIEGKSPSEIPDRDITGTLISLSVLRSEANSLHRHAESDRIATIIHNLNTFVKPPLVQHVLQTPASPSRLTVAFEFDSVHQSSPTPASDPGPIGSFSDPELDDEEYFHRLDELIVSQGPIEIPDRAERRKLLSALRRRINEVIDAGDYQRLERFDRLYDRLTAVSHSGFSNRTIRINQLRGRRKDLRARKLAVETEKQKELEKFEEKREIKRTELVHQCDEAMQKLKEEYPSPDHPLYSKISRQLMDLRDDERRFARARDYAGAKLVQIRADVQAEEEYATHEKNRAITCKRMKEQLLAKNKTVIQGFDDRYEYKRHVLIKQYDRQLEALGMMIQATTRLIQDLRNNMRPTDDFSP